MATKESCSLGVFALVSYVPDPISRIIEELRESIPGNCFAQPHITLVPPRPLQVSLGAATDFVKPILNQFSSIEVGLGDVHWFRESNLLYLDVSDGNNEIHSLHDALNRQPLEHTEQFEFRPHVTIGGPFKATDVSEIRETLRQAWLNRNQVNRFEMSEVAALWCDPGKVEPEWTRVWTHRLTSNGQTS